MDEMSINVRNQLGALLLRLCELETVIQQKDAEIAELKARLAALEDKK
jgi:BMFP domain-containing protein YqiC